jgi:hypothetical protein
MLKPVGIVHHIQNTSLHSPVTKEQIVMKNLTPRHIEKDESDRLGIKHGWYGIKVNGTLMTGPAPSHTECLKLIDDVADPPDNTSQR